MLSVVNCELPSTGSSMTVLFGVLVCLVAGLLVAGISRRSANRLSAVALVPVLALAFSVAPRDASEDCVTDTTEAAAEVTTTLAPTTTVAATTTTTLPRIALSITTQYSATISSVSVTDGVPTTVSSAEWTGTIAGSSTTFSVTGVFNTVGSVTGANCGPVSGSGPYTVTCTIVAGPVSLVLENPT